MPYPVQFEISPDVTQLSKGTIAISGVLRYDSMGVTLEYRTTDRGMTASDVRTVSVPLIDVAGVEYRRRLLGGRLVLVATRLDVFAGIPGAEDNRLVLKIKRRDGTAAARAAWDLQVAVEERKLRHLRE
jgi:hypothetical protein